MKGFSYLTQTAGCNIRIHSTSFMEKGRYILGLTPMRSMPMTEHLREEDVHLYKVRSVGRRPATSPQRACSHHSLLFYKRGY